MDWSFIRGRGEGWAGANEVGVIPFCAPENGGLHKIVQPFSEGPSIFVHPNFLHKKETTLKESTTSQTLFIIKMMIQITVTTTRSGRRVTCYLL